MALNSRSLHLRLDTGPHQELDQLSRHLALVGMLADLCEVMVAPSMSVGQAQRIAEHLKVPLEQWVSFSDELVRFGQYDMSPSEQVLRVLDVVARNPSQTTLRTLRNAGLLVRITTDPLDALGLDAVEPLGAPIAGFTRESLAIILAPGMRRRPSVLRVQHAAYSNPLDLVVMQDVTAIIDSAQHVADMWQARATAALLLLGGLMRGIRTWQSRGQDVEAAKLENRARAAEVKVKEALADNSVEAIKESSRAADLAGSKALVNRLADLAELTQEAAGRAAIAAGGGSADEVTALLEAVFDNPADALLKAGADRSAAAAEALSELGQVVDVRFGEQDS